MAVGNIGNSKEDLVWEEVRRPWWLQLMVGFGMGLGYSLRAIGWLIEHLGKGIAYVGREMILALQRLDYPETQRLTEGEKRMLLDYEETESVSREGRR